MTERGSKFSFAAVDWGTVLIYVVLVLLGLMNIYAAVYDSALGFFDFSSRAGSQLMWFGVSLVVAIFIMLLDSKYYYTWAYPVYWLSMLMLVCVLLFAEEKKGARSWIMFTSSFGFQPSEFVKFTVALALSRLMNDFSFNLKNRNWLLKVIGLIGLPLMLILLQNDTGSAIVFFSFMFMLFREGLNPWIYVVGIVLIALFIFSFLFEPIAILAMLLMVTLVVSSLMTRCWRDNIIYAATIVLTSLVSQFPQHIISIHALRKIFL
jgi:rod shape determining protein RodA